MQAKGAVLYIGNLVLGAIAAFEREMMLERQREGIDAAKRDGKYAGRQPTARRQRAEMQRLLAEGVNKSEIARRLGVSRRSAHRILREEAPASRASQL